MTKSKLVEASTRTTKAKAAQTVGRYAKTGKVSSPIGNPVNGAVRVQTVASSELITMRLGPIEGRAKTQRTPPVPAKQTKAKRRPAVSAKDISNAVREDSVDSSVLLSRIVTEGIPVAIAKAFEPVIDSMITYAVLPRKTWQDANASASKRLSTPNSERLIRTLKAIVAANAAFGEKRGEAWLVRATKAFDGKTPMAMLGTESGADAVEALLGRVKHGMTA